ncbi:hypothetical protein [Rhodococcus sp. ARC_M6]|uniref:DUF6928 family protein n=1 Tax=Rhodococcus sp. ARC_M6 TaxID=2928852 RepID=UPI0035B18DBD
MGGDCSFEDGDRELLQCERPFWAGEYDDVYRLPSSYEDFGDLPFTPTDFGEEALRALFGFVREARAQPSDLDPTLIMMHGFRVLPLREPDETESEYLRRHLRHRQFGGNGGGLSAQLRGMCEKRRSTVGTPLDVEGSGSWSRGASR